MNAFTQRQLGIFLFSFFGFFGLNPMFGQLADPRSLLKNSATQRANTKIGNGVESGLDKAEEGVKGLFKKKKKNEKPEENQSENQLSQGSKSNAESNVTPKQALVRFGKFDFVPGSKLLFEDLVEGETPGEFPSRWELGAGKVEVAELDGTQVIAFLEGNYATIFPLWKTKTDYLPEFFSIEFDLYTPTGSSPEMAVYLRPTEAGCSYSEDDPFHSWISTGAHASVGNANGYAPDQSSYSDRWHHISLSYKKGNVKIYSDENRLCNMPQMKGDPFGLLLGTVATPENPVYIKNIRIAEGGSDLYKRVVSDGKFISHGILFDKDKASLKPQSMGILNEIVQLMKANPDWKFEIGGHTDTDGPDAHNLTLSQDRATTVKDQLVSMGIDANRLQARGFGESKPLVPETDPEAKASNRRVEFVKL